MAKKLTLTTILILLLISCKKKISYIEFEQNVFDEVFLKIVDSTYKDKRLYTFFPNRDQSDNDPDFLIQRKMLENDTIGLVIAVSNERKIDLKKFKNRKFVFKNISEITEVNPEYEKWSEKYPKFAGAMSFSKIRFDDTYQSGEIMVSYSCGGKCGLGYNVFIKKVNQKWIVDKVEQTWIS